MYAAFRIGLATESEVRPLVWIDCVDDNVSWGPLYGRLAAVRVQPASQGGACESIDDHDDPRRRDFHVSYHESGEYHVVRGWVDGQRYRLPAAWDKKTHPVRIATPPELLDRRHYLNWRSARGTNY